MDAFDTIWNNVNHKENYVPRTFQTIGGMWTVDTWKRDGVTIQLMDEGYTRRIFSDCVDVFYNEFNGMRFNKGSEQDLEIISTSQIPRV